MYFADAAALTSSGNILGIIGVLIVLVLGALNVKNKYESTQDSDTITRYKNSNDSFATQSKADENTIRSQKREIDLLAQKAEILEKHVTQAPQINELAVQLAIQHKEMMEAFTAQTSNIGKMAKELGNVAKAVVKEAQDA